MALASAMAQGHRKKPPPSNVRSKKKGKTQKSGLCGGVEGDLYGIDSCRYVLLVNQAVSFVQKGVGPNLEVWLSRRVLATSGSLPRLVCSTVHPCPPFGRTWQLLPIYVAVEHGQSHSEQVEKDIVSRAQHLHFVTDSARKGKLCGKASKGTCK